MLQASAGLVKRFAQRHRHQFQMRGEARVFFVRECGEEMILFWTVGRGHGHISKRNSQRPDRIRIGLIERVTRIRFGSAFARVIEKLH